MSIARFALLTLLVGAAGAHARSATFDYDLVLPPRTEREICQYVQVRLGRQGDTLAGFHVKLRGAPSHHFHIFDATGLAPRTTEKQDGFVGACVMGEPSMLVTTDATSTRVPFPRGVRMPWHETQALVVNFHAFNPDNEPQTARARVKLDLRRPRANDRLARRWSLPVRDIVLAPHTIGTFTTTTTLDRTLEFVTLTGHMHVRGTNLVATLDGEPWYEDDDWRHPPLHRYRPPRVTPAGTRIAVSCTYDNGVEQPVRPCEPPNTGTACPLERGGRVDDAMCVLSGLVVSP